MSLESQSFPGSHNDETQFEAIDNHMGWPSRVQVVIRQWVARTSLLGMLFKEQRFPQGWKKHNIAIRERNARESRRHHNDGAFTEYLLDSK